MNTQVYVGRLFTDILPGAFYEAAFVKPSPLCPRAFSTHLHRRQPRLVQALVSQLRVTLQAVETFDNAIVQRAQSHPDFPLFQALSGAGPVFASRRAALPHRAPASGNNAQAHRLPYAVEHV